jgi:hypothetical protein
MSTLQYSISSVSTATGKVLKVLDNTNNVIYSYPRGTWLIVESYSASVYNFIIAHKRMGKLVIPINAINDFSGTAPDGGNYQTDYATLIALIP